MRLLLVFGAALIPWILQDPSPQEKLATELHEKVLKLGPVSFKVHLESIDAKGVKTLKHEIDVYLDLAGGSFSTCSLEIKGDEPGERQFLVWDRFDEARIWTQKVPGPRFRYQPIFRWLHEFDSDLKRLVEPTQRVLSFDEWSRSASSVFVLDMNPDPDGDRAAASFSFGKKETGGIRWLEQVKRSKPGDVEAGSEFITLKDVARGKTTTIDRGTGFLKSIRLAMKSGEERWLSVTGFKARAAKPAYEPPEAPETWIRPEDTPLFARDLYRTYLSSALQSILDHWDRLGKVDLKSDVESFLATVGARHVIAMQFAVRRYWTGEFLDRLRTEGEKLPGPDGDLKPLLARLKAHIERGEKAHAEKIEEARTTFSDTLESLVASCEAGAEAKAGLTARARAALESKNDTAARSRLKEPELEELLRETLRKDSPKD